MHKLKYLKHGHFDGYINIFFTFFFLFLKSGKSVFSLFFPVLAQAVIFFQNLIKRHQSVHGVKDILLLVSY